MVSEGHYRITVSDSHQKHITLSRWYASAHTNYLISNVKKNVIWLAVKGELNSTNATVVYHYHHPRSKEFFLRLQSTEWERDRNISLLFGLLFKPRWTPYWSRALCFVDKTFLKMRRGSTVSVISPISQKPIFSRR